MNKHELGAVTPNGQQERSLILFQPAHQFRKYTMAKELEIQCIPMLDLLKTR